MTTNAKAAPLGVMPEWLWREVSSRCVGSQSSKDVDRAYRLFDAILRYAVAGVRAPDVWWSELSLLIHRQTALNQPVGPSR